MRRDRKGAEELGKKPKERKGDHGRWSEDAEEFRAT